MWPMSLSIVFVVVPVVFVFIVAIVFVEVCLVNGCYNVYLFKIVLLLYLYCCSVFVVPVFVDVVIFFLMMLFLLLIQLFIRYNRTSLHTYSNKRKLVNEVNVQHEPHYKCKVFNQWTFCILLANMLQYYNKFVNRAASEAIVNALFSVDTFFVLRLVTSH